tara:strand:- start:1910 stop:2167 length:258 start_codon:yes stop_codon:yes gene_type:complete
MAMETHASYLLKEIVNVFGRGSDGVISYDADGEAMYAEQGSCSSGSHELHNGRNDVLRRKLQDVHWDDVVMCTVTVLLQHILWGP